MGCQKKDIYRMRKTRVGSRGLTRLRRGAGLLKERCLRRYIDNKKI